jgi:hypothetical protein
LFKGPEKTGFDSLPAGIVNHEGLQAVPPGLGRASEDAGELSDFAAVIPGDNFGGGLNPVDQSSPSSHILGFISMK